MKVPWTCGPTILHNILSSFAIADRVYRIRPLAVVKMQLLPAPWRTISRCLKLSRTLSTTASTPSTPWFVDEQPTWRREPPPHMAARTPLQSKPLPHDVPLVLSTLHAELSKSPLLESNGVEVCQPIPTLPGPALPSSIPKGRRQRGRSEFGLGVPDGGGSLWKWIVLVNVRKLQYCSHGF